MVKHVVTNVSEPEKKPKHAAMNITLHEHEEIKTLGVEGPDDFNTRNWKLGDTIIFTVIGIERKGSQEGIKVI